MIDRAHTRNGIIVNTYNGERGEWLSDSGERTAPVVIGDVKGNDRIIPALETINDTSTGTVGSVTVDTGWVVSDDLSNATRTITIRDLTAQEIADSEDVDALNHATMPAGIMWKYALCGMYRILKRDFPQLTVDQYLTNLDSYVSDIPDDKFAAKVKQIRSRQ